MDRHSRVIYKAPRVINYTLRENLYYWFHLQSSLTTVIYDRKTFIAQATDSEVRLLTNFIIWGKCYKTF
jgi:hypothetical protein